jgi:hypothetical protein
MIDAQTVAFTGTSDKELANDHAELVESVIRNHEIRLLYASVVTGAQHGIDTLAGIYSYLYAPGHDVLVIPAAPHNESMVEFAQEHHFEIIRMERISGGNGPNYLARNDKLVELADRLIAFPKTSKEVLRSGTWATIRRARKKGIPVDIYPLDVVR